MLAGIELLAGGLWKKRKKSEDITEKFGNSRYFVELIAYVENRCMSYLFTTCSIQLGP